ncbi:hypothetical protein [Candidatus Palauibacter sp.]|uniref:hypothetical protein n=1 Tax=Candidatus Palauibacter sp. TaxID=3101350 RepID=UPI003B01022C
MAPSSNFDPGVMLRALRFRANLAGYRLERGHYMDRPDDRADRWYLVPAADENAPRSGDGYPTLVRVREELDNLPNLRERSSPDE